MKKYDVVIIGGGPGGVTAAISARKSYPNKSILVIRKENVALIPCGIPYIFHSLQEPEDDILPDSSLQKNNIDLQINEVLEIGDKHLILRNGEDVGFDKLILATGSHFFVPPIPGIKKEGVFFIKKDINYLKQFKKYATESERIVIIGGGFIGVELADELIKNRKHVSIVEKMPALLSLSLDEEFSEQIHMIMKEKGVEIILGKSVQEITGGKKVNGVILEDGKKLAADLVVVAVGYAPNVELARKLGLKVNNHLGIMVDEYMRTSQKDIFAIGDCTAKRDFLTSEDSKLMLASTSMTQGRIAGSNLFEIKLIKDFGGTLGTFSTKIGGIAFGVTGITEKKAKSLGIKYVVGRSETMDRHPGKMPGASKTQVKMIYSKFSHLLLGAQISGGESVGEWVNMLSVIIQNKMTDMDIDMLQIGTHPMLTPSPIAYPLMNAAVDAMLKVNY